MKPYYKKSNGKVVELEQQDKLNFQYRNIVELVIPAGCEIVNCYNNQLSALNIPDGCKKVSCYNNRLIELNIPDGCVEVRADMKSITELNSVDSLRLYI